MKTTRNAIKYSDNISKNDEFYQSPFSDYEIIELNKYFDSLPDTLYIERKEKSIRKNRFHNNKINCENKKSKYFLGQNIAKIFRVRGVSNYDNWVIS
jgi:hypothetical protein